MRTDYCTELDRTFIGKEVSLCGWVHRRRDHGGVIFIDLRDRSGIAQIVIDPDTPESFREAERVRSEFVLNAVGIVRERPEGTINPDMPTGHVEVLVKKLDVLNGSETPPFQLEDRNVHDDIRLKFRYIDLRTARMQQNLRLRAKIASTLRKFLENNGFLEIETPMLTKATPEGARDFLVPSRVHEGHFFALPQSPQLFKQMLMMSGFDRYYQIVKCFRDEDLRADRQPEFTQLDIELSFVEQYEVVELMEELIKTLFKDAAGIELPSPFPRLTYHEVIEKYGTDKPDLRNPLHLVEVGDLMAGEDFKVFSEAAGQEGARVAALRVPKGGLLTRKQIDDYTSFVAKLGARGLAYIKVNDISAGAKGLQSPILKFLSDATVARVLDRVEASTGDLIFFGADSADIVNLSLGSLRDEIARDLDLLVENWAPLWVVEFPMFEWSEERKRWNALHHPFTSPEHDLKGNEVSPSRLLSKAYDMVINGYEVGGGSIRIHDLATQKAVFELLGIGQEEASDKFGFLLDALKYGCPPHGGIAFGLDRLTMILAETDSIRDVIAFPKTQSANCLLTSAPSKAELGQLEELAIRLARPEGKEDS